MIPRKYSIAHRRTVALLNAGYRLAFDKRCEPGPALSGWWLTRGEGEILFVAGSVAKRLLALGLVSQSESGEEIVYYDLADKARGQQSHGHTSTRAA